MAATKYLNEAEKATIVEDARQLRYLEPYIGDLALEAVHMGSLKPFIEARKAQGRKNRTINYGLQTVRHILNLAAGEWIDEYGKTWLAHVPKIKLLKEYDRKEPYPLSWDEQERLFGELPLYLRRMALFKVNTGTRDQEVCRLRWEWEIPIPEMETSVFIIPRERVKNRQDRLVILNSVALSVIEEVRGKHGDYVFAYNGHPIWRMYNRAWKEARIRADLPDVRVHDLKHTFGCRLRAAGVSFEDRQDLLGHKSNRVTTHYSAPELLNLIQSAERGSARHWHKSGTVVILRRQVKRLQAM